MQKIIEEIYKILNDFLTNGMISKNGCDFLKIKNTF